MSCSGGRHIIRYIEIDLGVGDDGMGDDAQEGLDRIDRVFGADDATQDPCVARFDDPRNLVGLHFDDLVADGALLSVAHASIVLLMFRFTRPDPDRGRTRSRAYHRIEIRAVPVF